MPRAGDDRGRKPVDGVGTSKAIRSPQRNQLPDVSVNLVPQLVRHNAVDLLRGEVVNHGVTEHDPLRVAQTREKRVGLLGLAAHVHPVHIRDRHPCLLSQALDPGDERLIRQTLKAVEQRQDQHGGQVAEGHGEWNRRAGQDGPSIARSTPDDGERRGGQWHLEHQTEYEPRKTVHEPTARGLLGEPEPPLDQMTANVGEGKPRDPGAGSHRGDERWGCQPFIRNAATRNIAEACGPPPETEPGHPPHRPGGSKQQHAQSNPAIPFCLGDVEAGNFEV